MLLAVNATMDPSSNAFRTSQPSYTDTNSTLYPLTTYNESDLPSENRSVFISNANDNVAATNDEDGGAMEYNLVTPRNEQLFEESNIKKINGQKKYEPKRNYLTPEILSKLEPHKISPIPNTDINVDTAAFAFSSIFEDKSIEWANAYQIQQTADLLASWHGFTIRPSGFHLICGCGQTHKQKKNENEKHWQIMNETEKQSDISEQFSKKRARVTLGDSLKCEFVIKIAPMTQEKGLDKHQRPVYVKSIQPMHNHPLNKHLMMKAKKSSHQYNINLDSCLNIAKMMHAGPIPSVTIRNYIQNAYPTSQVISTAMVCNIRMKCKKLMMDCNNDPNAIPGSEIMKIFDVNSMESAPEDWELNPVFSQIYYDAMCEVCTGDSHNPKEFTIVKVMEEVKQKMSFGYDYRIFYGPSNRPEGLFQMTPYEIHMFRRYGDVSAIDIQAKQKNTFGWSSSCPAGYNNNNKLVTFGSGLCHSEINEYVLFIILTRCAISKVPISHLKLIALDGKVDSDYLKQRCPGKLICTIQFITKISYSNFLFCHISKI